MMDDADLEAVANGGREMNAEERAWAIGQHDFLYEYVRTQDDAKRDALSDAELAAEVLDAAYNYVRCTM